MAVTIDELRAICRKYIGDAWFSCGDMEWTELIPAILGELDSCSDDRVVEIARLIHLI